MLSASMLSGLSRSARSAWAAGAKPASGSATSAAANPICATRRKSAARRQPESGRGNVSFMQSHLGWDLPGLFGRAAVDIGRGDRAAHVTEELHFPGYVVVVHAAGRHHGRAALK